MEGLVSFIPHLLGEGVKGQILRPDYEGIYSEPAFVSGVASLSLSFSIHKMGLLTLYMSGFARRE